MGQPHWADGSPIAGVFISRVQEGKSPTFELTLDFPVSETGDDPAPDDLVDELGETFPELAVEWPYVSYDDAWSLLHCFVFAGVILEQFPYDGEIMDDLKTSLACAFFRDANMRSEVAKWSKDRPFDAARHKEALIGIIQEIHAMQIGGHD